MTGSTDEVVEALSFSYGIKAHHLMCKELEKIVDRVSKICPAIESAQPRCRSGIDALCSLSLALEKGNLVIQHCTESSKLYLVITGDAVKSRCERIRNAFEQSLSELQSMVPLLLAAQISAIVGDLKDLNFILESCEEEAGEVILHLLRQASSSTEDSEFEAFQTAAVRLQLTSAKALLIEKRSIKKLLDKVRDTDQAKERILKYLLYLVRKYGQSNGGLQTGKSTDTDEDPDIFRISSHDAAACDQSTGPQDVEYEVPTHVSCKPMHPDEFSCPISRRLMHDPVVIASGQTYERMWIEKWFKEGHDTCPVTQKKLSHLSIVPNSSMKDLISKWCMMHGINISDPISHSIFAEAYHPKISSSTSIASFGSSLNNVPIQLDDTSLSFGSPDVIPVMSTMTIESLVSHQADGDSGIYQSSLKFSHGIASSSLSNLSELPWETQCRIMEDVSNHLDDNEQACHSILPTSFFQMLVTFFKDACDRSDVKAQRIGARVLRIFVTKRRNEVPYCYEDVFYLFASLIDSEITDEAMAIVEVLSEDQSYKFEVVASSALPSILKILESQNRELQIPAVRVLCNLSSQSNVGNQIVHLGYIPKMISLLGDRSLALYGISILRNVCITKEGRLAVGEANNLIACIVELLETGSNKEQEHAVAILLSLCSNHIEYCKMVLEEGVIPSLVSISVNGNAKGKEFAMELLRLLRDTCNDIENSALPAESNRELPCESINCSTERQSVSKTPGYFRRKFRFFPKPRSLALY